MNRCLFVFSVILAGQTALAQDENAKLAKNPHVTWQNARFVVDTKCVWRVDDKGKAQIFAPAGNFPTEPSCLKGIAVDESGVLYVSDSGSGQGKAGAIYRIDRQGKVKLVADSHGISSLKTPGPLVMDGLSFLLLLDTASGELLRINIAKGSAVKVAEGFEGGSGLAWDPYGQLVIASASQGKTWGIARPGEEPQVIESKNGSTELPANIPGHELDTTPLRLSPVPAFPNLKWTGWQAETAQGKPVELRPVFLTHADDGTNRNFVTIQQGIVHVFPNDPKADKTKVFLDIHDKVNYSDNENEQGMLGLAFHPNYKKNGEFFVFYTVKKPRLTNVISRFRVSKDDPDKADPNSEEEIFRIRHPFWNHDGGTICFGPDGYLYVALGDGGAANDPYRNGQNPKVLLGKVLRIDVDHQEEGKKYGIPKDNPFVGVKDHAPEIWTYGMRNPWRITFDRKTGKLWAGDVGQNLYEEIDILEKGGNYGWNIREGLHPFSVNGVGPRKDLIEPIWEYNHDVGKSITGGLVYRGKRLPELEGYYVYGDYVSRLVWALKYDETKKRVVANRPLGSSSVSIFSFGEDDKGELYLLGPSLSGQSIFRFE
jgi:glucose/arabinose dehydrogenase